MQDYPPSDTHHRGGANTGKQPGRRLIRFVLYALSYLGGAATGTSATALLLYQPADLAWAWLGVGGLLACACAVGLFAYFPKEEGSER